MGISILPSMQGGETERCNDDRKAVTQEVFMEGGVIGVCVCVIWQRKGSVDAAVVLYPRPPPTSSRRPGSSRCSVSIVQEAVGERGLNQSVLMHGRRVGIQPGASWNVRSHTHTPTRLYNHGV